eukprot:3426852-Rhodomonas_salina.12
MAASGPEGGCAATRRFVEERVGSELELFLVVIPPAYELAMPRKYKKPLAFESLIRKCDPDILVVIPCRPRFPYSMSGTDTLPTIRPVRYGPHALPT